jgi:signal transduction histidine kinase
VTSADTESAGPTPGARGPDLGFLAREQAALRRVATLVARGAPPAAVFAAQAQEAGRLFGVPLVETVRFDDDAGTIVGTWGAHPTGVGTRRAYHERSVMATVRATGRPARIDDYATVPGTSGDQARGAGFRSAVGVPIVVENRTWGVTIAITDVRGPLPPDTEARLSHFSELVGLAIANAQAQERLAGLAEEHAALRRVAMLVAGGAEPQTVFVAVCEEAGRLARATSVNLDRYVDGGVLAVAGWSVAGSHIEPGTWMPLEPGTIDVVTQAGEPGRIDSYEGITGELTGTLAELGTRSEVGAPVLLDGRVWGALIAGTVESDPFAPGTEHRLASFAELVGMAVSNAAAREDLIASRARIVAASDAARRRLARDLHDGAQQRLVSTVMSLQLASQRIDDDAGEGRRLLHEALGHARESIDEVRELAAGVHPSLLTNRGLRAAVEELTHRSPVPVDVSADDGRYPPSVEAAAYFLVAEALTNMAKHARAARGEVAIAADGDRLIVDVRDDGAGGAGRRGSGLQGLEDRIAALGGHLHVDSPRGEGTWLHAVLPLTRVGEDPFSPGRARDPSSPDPPSR